jgi:hypothetical protein
MSTSRTLAAALAIAALTVPAAQARPADNAPLALTAAKAQHKHESIPNIDPPVVRVAAANARAQDLRHLRAGAANVDHAADANVGTYTPGDSPGANYTSGPTAGGQYTPGAAAAYSQPLPATPTRAVHQTADSGVNQTTIGLGIAGSLLAIACVAGLTRRNRRVQRARVTA